MNAIQSQSSYLYTPGGGAIIRIEISHFSVIAICDFCV